MGIGRLLSLAAGVALAGCGVQIISKLSGETVGGPVTKRTFAVEPFSRISAGSIFEIDYSVSDRTHVEIEAAEGVFDHIEVVCRDGELELRTKGNFHTNDEVKVRLTSPSLEDISLSGACNGQFKGFSARNFSASLSGSSTAKLVGHATEYNVSLSGNSELQAEGGGRYALTGSLSGNSGLNLRGEADKLTINAGGASQIDLERVAASSGDLQLSGSCTLAANGSIDALKATVSGNSSIDLATVRVGIADLTATGASHISVGETRTLSALASGASSISYKGNPQVTKTVTGVSIVGPG